MKRIALIITVIVLGTAFLNSWRGRAQEEQQRLFIIDDDIGMLRDMVAKEGTYMAPGLKVTDPDGGLELLYALRDPRVKVLGVTCSMGCSTLDVCMASAKKILELAGREDVPVLAGAASSADLGQPTDASRFIINTVMSHPGEVEILATAPLTNIATAILHEGCLPKNWKTLHFATGEFMGQLGEKSDGSYGRFIGYKDLNINADPEAVKVVLEQGGDFPIYPNEVMDDVWITRAGVREIASAGTPLGDFVARELQPFLYLMGPVNALHGHPGIYLHGLIPMAIALDPEISEPPRMLRVAMKERKPGGSGFTVTDDPNVPERPVYVKVTDPDRVQKLTVKRSY